MNVFLVWVLMFLHLQDMQKFFPFLISVLTQGPETFLKIRSMVHAVIPKTFRVNC